MEITFSYLFNAIVRPQIVSESVRRAYGAIETARGRRQMIDASAEVFFAKFSSADLSKQLADLMTLYTDAAARRNDIAHGYVMSRGPDYGWYLEANMYGNKRDVTRTKSLYAYTAQQINAISKEFSKLVPRANAMNDVLKAHYHASPPKPREQY